MKHILSLAGAVLLLGLAVALPANAKMKEEAVWTPQVTLNHFAPAFVWAGPDLFSLELERSVGNATYYMVLHMWVDDSGAVQVQRYCTGDEKLCLAIGNGKRCNSDGFTHPWCYYLAER